MTVALQNLLFPKKAEENRPDPEAISEFLESLLIQCTGTD